MVLADMMETILKVFVISAWHRCLCESLRNLHVCRQISSKAQSHEDNRKFFDAVMTYQWVIKSSYKSHSLSFEKFLTTWGV